MTQLTDALGHRAHRAVHAPRTGLEQRHGDESEYGRGQHDTVKTERELRNPRDNRSGRRGSKVPGQTECPQQRDHFAQAGCTGCDQIGGKQHVETVVLLSKLNTKQHIEVELNLDELDLTAAESKATYDEIKAYVLEKYGLKVSSLYISQVKRKCGLDVGQNYNLSKKEDAKVPQCPSEKEAAIMEALKHFHMV